MKKHNLIFLTSKLVRTAAVLNSSITVIAPVEISDCPCLTVRNYITMHIIDFQIMGKEGKVSKMFMPH